MQIAAHLDGRPIRVMHPIELLDHSMQGTSAQDVQR
jgi:hypothetical protein